jgi:hypothetical protein
MNIIFLIGGFILLFLGLYLIFFTEKFLSYDSKLLPNFWDSHGARDILLLNWKSRRLITIVIGVIFLLGSIAIFLSIYYAFYAKLA